MKIVRISESTIPIACDMRNARVDFSEITASVVAVVTDQFRNGRQVVGYAFNSFGRYGCCGPLRERFIPRLLAANPGDWIDFESGIPDPQKAVALLLRREKAGAHAERSMAVGTLELALWDIVGKLRGLPLYQVLAETFNVPDGGQHRRLPCYAGGGFYREHADVEKLNAEIQGYLETGYTAVKIKAGGLPLDKDLRRIESVLSQLQSSQDLALDASCAFNYDDGLAYAKAIAPYNLRWLEEPCEPEDFDTYRAISEVYPGVLAGGENLFSNQEVVNFLRYGPQADRLVLQPDPPLAYGIGEFHRIVETALQYGVQRKNILPHGGNLMSLHVAAGLALGGAESYPGLFGAFSGFGNEVQIVDGFVTLPQSPGIGFEEQPDLYKVLQSVAGL